MPETGRTIDALLGDVARWFADRPEQPAAQTDTPTVSRRQIIDAIGLWRLYPLFVALARRQADVESRDRMAADAEHNMDIFEGLICREMTARNIDPAGFSRSSRFCRRFFDMYPECADDSIHWPGAILENPTLPAADREAIEGGEDAIARLAAKAHLEAQQEAAQAGGDPVPTKPPPPKPNVNARMLELVQKDLQRVCGWTAKQWASELHCVPSAIVATPTWTDLEMARERQRAEKAADRRRRKRRVKRD